MKKNLSDTPDKKEFRLHATQALGPVPIKKSVLPRKAKNLFMRTIKSRKSPKNTKWHPTRLCWDGPFSKVCVWFRKVWKCKEWSKTQTLQNSVWMIKTWVKYKSCIKVDDTMTQEISAKVHSAHFTHYTNDQNDTSCIHMHTQMIKSFWI